MAGGHRALHRAYLAIVAGSLGVPCRHGEPIGLEALDFVYTPSRDVAADMADFTTVLGGRLVFAIEDGGVRAAMVELPSGPPSVLLTDHVEGERPILVYRVADLPRRWPSSSGAAGRRSVRWRSRRGRAARSARRGGHRIALYQLIRPQVLAHFEGRRDF